MNKEKIKPLLLKIFEILSMVFITIYPPLYMYFNNVGEATFMDALPITLVFIGLTALFFGIFYIILKDITKAVFSTNILVFLSLNFKKIEDLLIPLNEHIFYWHIVLLVLFLVVNIVIILKQFNFKEAKNINILIGLVYFTLLMLVIIPAIPNIVKYSSNKSSSTSSTDDTITSSTLNADKPNFYYFIFDEYGGYENIKEFLGFEDELYDDLSDLKINYSKTSHNKDWITMMVIPDLMNLQYVSFYGMVYKDMEPVMENPTLFRVCKSAGYKINILSEWKIFNKEYADYAFYTAYGTGMETLKDFVLKETIYYPVRELESTDKLVQDKLLLLDELKNSYKLGKEGMCTIGYVALPHSPMIFKSDGSINDKSMYQSRDTDILAEQQKFTAKKISEIVHEIVANDPNAVILVQSDHGTRFKWMKFFVSHINEPTKEEYKLMTNTLNVLYYKGEKVDIEGQSGYQTLNETVQKLFGYKDGYKDGYITDIEEAYENRDKTTFR